MSSHSRGCDRFAADRWHHDLWHTVIRAAPEGNPDQVDLSYHPGLREPAVSRYGATTSKLLGWFKQHNGRREYGNQVKPHNFLIAFQGRQYQPLRGRVRAVGLSRGADQCCRKGRDNCSVQFAHADQLCREIIEGKLMPTWLRSLVNAFLGKVPGKTSRLDTATRMMIDADFSLDRELPRENPTTLIRRPLNKRDLKDQN